MTWRSDPASIAPGARSGYSLLELLVVMTILALIAAIAPVAYRTITPALETRQAATEMAAFLRQAQAQALHEGRDVTVLIDVEEKRAWLDGEDTAAQWSDTINVVAVVAASEQRSSELGAIRFFSDGGSTGGQLRFLAKGREYDVDVDWLLGLVQVSRPAAQ